jgi:hypothetical protein
MSTVLRVNGFKVRIRTHDHPPPHVHVFKGDGQVKINIGSETDPAKIVRVWGMTHSDAKKALAIVEENQMYLLANWRKYYE